MGIVPFWMEIAGVQFTKPVRRYAGNSPKLALIRGIVLINLVKIFLRLLKLNS